MLHITKQPTLKPLHSGKARLPIDTDSRWLLLSTPFVRKGHVKEAVTLLLKSSSASRVSTSAQVESAGGRHRFTVTFHCKRTLRLPMPLLLRSMLRLIFCIHPVLSHSF